MKDPFPPVRFPMKLRDELQADANHLAKERGRSKMSISEFVAEIYVWYKASKNERNQP